jgi:RND family efflux transporter MFP subunit
MSRELFTAAVLAAGALAAGAAPPEAVVSHPVTRDVAETADFTGRIEAAESVELRARVTGYLARVTYKPGQVKQGDLLFEIDPRPYQAELEKARSELSLREAHLRLATVTLERMRTIAASAPGAVGAGELDKLLGEREEAQVAVQAAKASLEVYKLNLDFTRVTAPISGRIGPPLIDPGNIVRADDTRLANLVSTDPVYAYFDLDERTYLRLRRAQADAPTRAESPVQLGLADEAGVPHSGKLDATDVRVDPATGTLRCRAVFPNSNGVMTPGMFVRVRLAVAPPAPALLVPERAVGTGQGEPYVLVVNDRNVVERREVRLGPAHEGLRVVREGLRPDDRVVTRDVATLLPGTTVHPRQAGPTPSGP